jgi:PAS domain S-box-containing protein
MLIDQLLHQVAIDAHILRTILERMPVPVYFTDASGRIAFWNERASQAFGWTAEQAQGRLVSELLRSDAASLDRLCDVHQSIGDLPGAEFKAQVVGGNGIAFWGEWRLSPLHGHDGQPIGSLAQVRDLTLEREAELMLQEQTEIVSAVIHSASDAVISVDEGGRVTLFNPAAERIFDRTSASMLGQPLDVLMPERFRAGHGGDLTLFGQSKATRRAMGAGRVLGLRADGAELELEASISHVTVRGRHVLTAILRDVTDRVRAERELVNYQLELSELTQRLMAQEKATTRALAQTLHDRLGQTLTAIRLSYDALDTSMGGRTPAIALPRVRAISSLIDQAIGEVRQALVELRPPLLEDQGLVAAIENELRARSDEAHPVQLRLTVEAATQGVRWPPDVEYAVFMIAREAVSNALQHAESSQVAVNVGGGPHRLQLEITDDGIGLPAEVAFGRPGHLGMVGMRERALAIAARFSVEPDDGLGTRVLLLWDADA